MSAVFRALMCWQQLPQTSECQFVILAVIACSFGCCEWFYGNRNTGDILVLVWALYLPEVCGSEVTDACPIVFRSN